MTTIQEILEGMPRLRMSTEMIRPYADLMASVKRQQSVIASLATTAQLIDAAAVPTGLSAAVKALGIQQTSWARALRFAETPSTARIAAAYAHSSMTWAMVAESNLRMLEAVKPPVALSRTASGIMRPLTAYSAFSASILERLSRVPAESDAAAGLARALRRADSELREMPAVARAMVPLATEEPGPSEPRRIGRLNLLVVEREELTAVAGSGGVLILDGGDVVTLAGQLARKARSISSLIVSCNEASSMTGRGPVFKYTDVCVAVMCDLSWLVPRTRNQLGDFVDALFFALYEGAGSDHLRFIETGPLARDECDFVWSLKHLRNKWLRHDPNHGSEKSVAQSKVELSEALAHFGLDHIPTKRAEFRQLHESIVIEAVDFLERLLERLQTPPSRSEATP